MLREDYSDTVLIVLGHGTSQNEGSALPVLQHTDELRRRRLFAEVYPAFWKQEPQLKSVLAGLKASRVFIVPLFISEGYFCSEVIPRELGFGSDFEPQTSDFRLRYCQPVGTHDRMTEIVLARAAQIVASFPFPRAPKPKDVTLFLAGHGTGRNARSRESVERQVELIRARQLYAAVHAIFMEEPPFIREWHALAVTRNVVVVPFFISDGLHVVEDIPVLLGEPERLVKERLAGGQPTWRNPTEREGKRVWYSAAVGTDPGIADVILERVREAAS